MIWTYESEHPYSDDQACSYRFECQNEYLRYRIKEMDIEDDSTCDYDKLTINGGSEKSFCGKGEDLVQKE